MKILIETMPHVSQRYNTCGDWQFKKWGDTVSQEEAEYLSDSEYNEEALIVSVSDLGDWRMEALIGMHEAVEALLCKHAGVTEEMVDQFDLGFESSESYVEPGDDERAPYHRQHYFATAVERDFAIELGVDWATYEAKVNSL